MLFSATQKAYEDEYCTCIETNSEGPWCADWNNNGFEFCTLKGGVASQYCPGALKYNNHDEFYSSHPLVCNKNERKYFLIISHFVTIRYSPYGEFFSSNVLVCN